MKFNRISMLAGGLVLLVAIAAIAFYAGLRAGRHETQAAREPQQVPIMNNQARWSTQATYDNWQMRCRDGATTADKKSCVGLLEVINTQKHQLILGWLMGLNGKGGLTTTLQTPTGVLVGRGLDMTLGTSGPRHFTYSTCGQNGCEASMEMDDVFISDLIGADKAQITIYTTDGKAVNIGIPVKGADKVVETFQ